MVPLDVQSAEKASFGPFELDIRTAELFSRGKIPISRRPASYDGMVARRSLPN